MIQCESQELDNLLLGDENGKFLFLKTYNKLNFSVDADDVKFTRNSYFFLTTDKPMMMRFKPRKWFWRSFYKNFNANKLSAIIRHRCEFLCFALAIFLWKVYVVSSCRVNLFSVGEFTLISVVDILVSKLTVVNHCCFRLILVGCGFF